MFTKKLMVAIIVFFCSLNTIVICTHSTETQPCTVRGYVYLDGNITTPEQVKLEFAEQNISGTIPGDPVGYYIVDFNEDIGKTGTFYVTIDGKTYIAEQTMTVEYDVYAYRINLTINTTSANNPPEVEIIKPKTGFVYFREWGIPLNFLKNTVIIGDNVIEINATDPDNEIDKVELKIEGIFSEETATLDKEPYNYNWDKFGFGIYTITAVAYDTLGETDKDGIIAFKFF
jgi:hypothetical protein